jgi:aquaporin Z
MKPYLAELVGTFVLVFGGVGSAVLAGDKIGNVGVALAFGLALLAMAYAIRPISGCHINSAVTVGLLLRGRIRRSVATGYVTAQVAGAIVAAGPVLLVALGAPGGAPGGLCADGFGDRSPGHYPPLPAFVAETILTSFLVLTVLGATANSAAANYAAFLSGSSYH